MDVIEYVEKIDERMIKINKNYNYIYNNIHNYLNDGIIEYAQLMDFEVSLQDLSIQLNSLVFLFNQKENNINNKININNIKDYKIYNDKQADKKADKIDYVLDKTIFHFLPLLFMYFMIFDNESILYIKDFIDKKDKDNKINYINNTNTNTNTNNIQKEDICDDLD
jgi:hypothetical protein